MPGSAGTLSGVIVVVGTPAWRAAEPAGPDGRACRVALAAAERGAAVELIGRAGDDPAGDAMLLALARAHVGHVALLRDPARPTPILAAATDDELSVTRRTPMPWLRRDRRVQRADPRAGGRLAGASLPARLRRHRRDRRRGGRRDPRRRRGRRVRQRAPRGAGRGGERAARRPARQCARARGTAPTTRMARSRRWSAPTPPHSPRARHPADAFTAARGASWERPVA